MKNKGKKMLHQFVGIQGIYIKNKDILIYLQLVLVVMIF